MARKSLIFSVGLALSITLSCIPTTARLNAAQQNADKPDPRNQANQPQADAKKALPVTPIDPTPYTGEETRESNKENVAIQRDIATSSRAIAKDTNRVADYTYSLMWIGGTIGTLEIALLFFQALYTGRSANAARVTAEAARLSQRPYVGISHHPPGLQVAHGLSISTVGEPQTRNIKASFAIINSGNTPARVIRLLIQKPRLCIGPIPDAPPYDLESAESMDMILRANDSVNVNREWELLETDFVPAISLTNQLANWPDKLLLLGFVEYVDSSNTRRRASYGRYYDRTIDTTRPTRTFHEVGSIIPRQTYDDEAFAARNNLPFITLAGYNDDVEIGKDGKPKG